MSVDIHRLMKALATEHPIFHSEADFQLTLFRYINAKLEGCTVQLEKLFRFRGKNFRVDIWIPGESIAVELKHFTQKVTVCREGELFALKDQAARDLARHGFLADVQRLEELVRDDANPVQSGFAVILTNDPGLWNLSPRKTNDIDSHIHQDRSSVTDKLTWRKKGIPIEGDEISLRDSYTMNWRSYSDLKTAAGEFRYLALKVGGRA